MDDDGAPALHVFGGKVTTCRLPVEAAPAKLRVAGGRWTARAPLAGGDIPHDGIAEVAEQLRADHPSLEPRGALRLARAYGAEAARVLSGASGPEDRAAVSAPT